MPEEVQPLAPGGVWLSEGGGTGTPHYVVNPDHVARLQSEGYQPIADPRISADEPEEEEEAKHDDTSGGSATARAKSAHKRGAGRVDATH